MFCPPLTEGTWRHQFIQADASDNVSLCDTDASVYAVEESELCFPISTAF